MMGEEHLGKEEKETNQKEWPSGKDEKHPGESMKAALDKVLSGQALLQGNINSLMSVVAGQSRPQDLSVMELSGLAKAVAPEIAAVPLLKGGDPTAWLMAKSTEVQRLAGNGGLQLAEELAAESILSTAQAFVEGHIGMDVLAGRVRACDGTVRRIFGELLEG